MSLVFSIGVQGSASTWAYNICRELLLTRHAQVDVEYCDSMGELGGILQRVREAGVIKMHQPDDGLVQAVTGGTVPAVITLRDPRDGIVSLMERFGFPFDKAMASISASVGQIARIHRGRALVLRYEDRFFEQPAAVGRIAGLLGIEADAARLAEIFGRYTGESVRGFMQGFDALPGERVRTGNGSRWDSATMIHKTHLGDGLSGKWRERLSATEQDATLALLPLLQMWGYEG